MPVPNMAKLSVPTFDVVANGKALPLEAQAYVVEVKVDVSVSMPSMFSLVIAGADTQPEDVPWVDDDLFAVGGSVEVKMGYDDDLESVFTGEITGLEPEYCADRLPALTVRGYDRRHRLMCGARTRTFLGMKDSDIAQQIATAANLQFEGKDSQTVHDYVFQANQTDLDFLQERARAIHYEVVVADKTLYFRPVSNAESEIVTLTMERDLLEFYPRLASLHQVSDVTVRGWSPKDKHEIIGRAGKGAEGSRMGGDKSDTKDAPHAFGDRSGMISHRPIFTQAEADQLAQSHFRDIALSLISGEGICLGRTDLLPGKVIKIEGVGKRFGGQYYVTSVTHRHTTQRGFHTHFEVRRNAS